MARILSDKKPAPIHSLEKVLTALLSVHLCFLPWALGTVHVWSQLVSFGLAASGLVIALLPRTLTAEQSHDGRPKRYMPARRLVVFPGFWLGLSILFYALVQALNPAWTYMSSGGDWWMVPVSHVSWLPSGAIAPFADSNPWRSLLVWSSAWMLGCSLWIGLTRRASLRALLVAITINAAVLALAGILQHVAGNGRVLGFIPPPTDYTVATFPYKNHAGAFFNLLLAVSAATATCYYRLSERRLERPSPAPIFAICAIVLALMVVLSFSRAATALMLGYALACIFLGAGFLLRNARRPNLQLVGLAAISLIVLLWVSIRPLRLEQAADRFQQLFTTDRAWSIESRQLAAKATWEMALDQPLIGWGAGCFRFLFPLFQQNHPQIYQPSSDSEHSFYFEHAHNDYLEFLAELGVVGCAPLVALLALWIAKLVRGRIWRNPPALLLALGLIALLAHCWIDFHLQCPAILLTACALAVVTVRWNDLETKRGPS